MIHIKLFPGILHNRNEESTLIAFLLLLSFLMGIALTFFFTVSISKFLIEFTASTLPYVYLLSGLMSYMIWAIYQKLGSRLAFSTLILAALGFLLAATAVLTVLSSIHPGKWLSFMLLVWVSSFLFIKNVCFWGMASKLFNMSQGKRLFGFIGSGEVLSNITGFFAVPFLLRVINTTGLLSISIAALFLALLLVLLMTRKYASMFTASQPVQNEPVQGNRQNRLEKDRFFLRLLIFSIFPVFVFYLVDYLFLNQAHDQFSDVSVLANFMGYFLGAVSIAELFFKSLVFGKVLKHYGVKAGVLCLPLSLLFSSGLTLLAGLIWNYDSYILFSIIALSKLLERSVNNGIHAPGMQLLYQPVQTSGRTGFQSKVEGISSALGNIAAGGLILLLSAFDITGGMVYNVILVLTLSAWIITVAPLYSAYKQKLHDALQRYNYRQRSVRKVYSGKDILIRGAGSADKVMALAGTRLLHAIGAGPASVQPDNGMHPEFPHALPDLERLLSRTPSLAVKHRILEIYSKTRTGDAKSLLLNKLVYPEREVQMITVRLLYSLEYIATSDERTEIKQKITEVVGLFAWLNASILDLEKYAPAAALVQSLKAERKEYAVMLYMLLSFVYGYATIDMIKNNLQDRNDAESFIYALEVAANTLEEDMKALVFPLFENIAPEKGLEKLNAFFPQQRLPVVNRLIAILYKDYARITLWTKVNALVVLTEFYAREDARQEIIACLFHEYAELREVALRCLLERSSPELAGIVAGSPKLSTLDLNKLQQQSIFSKVLLLKDTALFHVTPEHKLLPIAALFDWKKLQAGDRLSIADHCIIVLSGTLLFRNSQRTMTATAPFTFIQDVSPALHIDHTLAQEESSILICNQLSLLHLIIENPALTRNLLKFATEALL